LERLVHEGLESALGESSSREKADAAERGVRLREVIGLEQVTTLVQPIVRLADMSVIGYEALSRGPEGGEFEHPDKLFCAAYDSDLVAQLENLCRKKAITAARELAADRLLFINIEPSSVTGRDIRDAVFSGLIGGANLSPDRIVLEITERNAIVDFNAFRSTLEYLRALGFSIAIDDAGSGYASLQCLAEVRPEWLKVDISLIRGIDSDRVRRLLVQSLILFTEEAGVNLIAEGVETEDELAVIRELGVLYAQGFLFCEPRPPFPPDADVCV
jgi:EAL domain-containing protein (putative c-di-GMP-specific phosphodiesterase class I)